MSACREPATPQAKHVGGLRSLKWERCSSPSVQCVLGLISHTCDVPEPPREPKRAAPAVERAGRRQPPVSGVSARWADSERAQPASLAVRQVREPRPAAQRAAACCTRYADLYRSERGCSNALASLGCSCGAPRPPARRSSLCRSSLRAPRWLKQVACSEVTAGSGAMSVLLRGVHRAEDCQRVDEQHVLQGATARSQVGTLASSAQDGVALAACPPGRLPTCR